MLPPHRPFKDKPVARKTSGGRKLNMRPVATKPEPSPAGERAGQVLGALKLARRLTPAQMLVLKSN